MGEENTTKKTSEMEVSTMRKEDEEKRVMENIAKAIPLMSDFEKGYILGMVEAKRREKEQEKKRRCQPA